MLAKIGSSGSSHLPPSWFVLFMGSAVLAVIILITQGVLWLFKMKRSVQQVSMLYHLTFILGFILTRLVLGIEVLI
jgi:hypothetical protein